MTEPSIADIFESRSKRDKYEYVYFIEDTVNGAVKVGKSSSPKRRLKTLQTGTLNQLTLTAVIPCSRGFADQVEKYIHQLLAEDHLAGEWFARDSDLVEALIEQYELSEHIEVSHGKNNNVLHSNKPTAEVAKALRRGEFVNLEAETWDRLSSFEQHFYDVQGIK